MVMEWNEDRRFGFIHRDCSDEISGEFCHVSGLVGKWTPRKGDTVSFELVDSPRGPRCEHVVLIEPDGGPAAA
jgi:cold shock CspA family protein